MIIDLINHIGMFFFAVSGVLTAADKQMDLLGGVFIAFITSFGGGTIRDLLLNVEIEWLRSLSYITMVFAGTLAGIVFRERLKQLRRTFFIFDTVGLGFFAIYGLQKSLLLGHYPVVALFLGVITATFGGVLRDVLCNEIPLIFRKEIYASAALAGGLFFLMLNTIHWVPDEWNALIASFSIMIVRVLAVKYRWQMPQIRELSKK
jgi:uncharacterized membrane protein YeiH